ncbi:XRE family transcriptional regulator [Streptomyces armeniacus]|uniref:XRE family transcriptional regulator n=1 Tax=Streptomyces armeniacus TaxID=83291 RepID=A0A345XMU5_9ACTN|nr:helix-turn-helix transcriptional regulator [Streptomyces armeniacus]AXK32961.1 XRE family transcriptional regulator [Streptomyces armeniacus]
MAWQYCGSQMKLWRERAGVRREDLASEAGYSYEAIKSMERGVRKPQLAALRVADELCGAKGLLVAATEFLKPEPFPSYSQDFMQAEAEAVVVCWYETQFIPGLLQTEGYVRALLNAHCPPLDDETVDERIVARLARQPLLDRQSKSFNFVVEEAALRRRVGDADVRRAQLEHLMVAGRARHVNIQVMPAELGSHPGLKGPFILLESSEREHLGYEEGQTTGVLYSDSEKLSILRQRHEMILRLALSPEESARFIGELMEAL